MQPELPRRITKQGSSAPRAKMGLMFKAPQNSGTSLKDVNMELYEALLVDRDNKDATIRDNEVHIDELHERIRKLEKELGRLQSEKDELTERLKKGFQKEDDGTLVNVELQSSELICVKQELEKASSGLLEVKEKCLTLENTVCETRTLLASVEQDRQNLLSKVNQLKLNEEESRCRYETDIKELDAFCKKLVDEMSGMKAEEDRKKKNFEEDVKKLKEEMLSLGNTNSDLDSKLSQKQQMILMLQSQLSSAELELEECKSENEKMAAEFQIEKTAMTEKHGCDMEKMRNLIKELETLLSEEREMRMQEIQTLEENVLNGSVVRENLETIITEKQSAFSALNDKYFALEAEFERSCMEQKLVTEAHRLEMNDMERKYEEELIELREKEKEAENRIKTLTDDYCVLECKFEKSCIEQKLMTEAQKCEFDGLHHNYEEKLNELRVAKEEAEKKVELMADNYRALEGEFEKSCLEQKFMAEAHKLKLDDMQHKYKEELNELKEKERDMEKEIESLSDKYHALEAEFEKSGMEQKLMTEAHRLEIDDICNKHNREINELIVEKKKAELEIVAMSERYHALEIEFEKSHMEHKHVTESYRLEVGDINRKHEEELYKMKEEVEGKEREIDRIIKEIIEHSMEEVEKQAKEVKTEVEENLNDVKNTAEKRIKEFEMEATRRMNDCEARMEVKLKETELEMQVYMEKTLQVEENLRRMTHHRDELRISNMENQLTIVDLQDKIDTLVAELNSARESYETDIAQARNEYNASREECKKLKIGISNIQASLKALQLRLLESENYVEELANTAQQCDAQKMALEEQVNVLTLELDASKQSMSELERDTVQQIEETRRDLFYKLEEFKAKADKNIAAKEEEILEHRHKCEEFSARIFELNETLSAVEEANSEHEHEIEALTEKLDHQRECAKIATQQIATLEASNAIYQHQVQTLTAELEYQKDFSQKASSHIAALAAAKANQEKGIHDLTSDVIAEREMLKLDSGTEELATPMKYNIETSSDVLSSLKENLYQYKEELIREIQKLRNDIKAHKFDIEQKNLDVCRKKCEIKSATDRIAELMSENEKKDDKIVEHNKKIEELCSQVEELKRSLQENSDSELKLKLAEKESHCQR